MVESKQEYFIMTQMISETTCFKIFPEALYTTDVTFQQFNRSTAFSEKKTKLYYSGKHHLCGSRPEIGVLPNGLDIDISTAYHGSMRDIDIFWNNAS